MRAAERLFKVLIRYFQFRWNIQRGQEEPRNFEMPIFDIRVYLDCCCDQKIVDRLKRHLDLLKTNFRFILKMIINLLLIVFLIKEIFHVFSGLSIEYLNLCLIVNCEPIQKIQK